MWSMIPLHAQWGVVSAQRVEVKKVRSVVVEEGCGGTEAYRSLVRFQETCARACEPVPTSRKSVSLEKRVQEYKKKQSMDTIERVDVVQEELVRMNESEVEVERS